MQAGLQRLAKPWYRRRALRVFRDDTGLAVNAALWDSIASALEASRFFVVLVSLSPDGTRLASVSNEGRVLLEGVDGDGRTTVAEGKGPTFTVDFSADGRYLAVGFANGTALLIDVQRRPAAPVALVGHAGLIFGVAFSPDDEVLAVGSTGSVTLWDLATRQRIGELVHPVGPYELAFSPDGLSLATTWADNSLIVWNLDLREWRRRACETAGRNLTSTEWDQYVGAGPFRTTCSQWPEG